MQALGKTELTWGERHKLEGEIKMLQRLLRHKFGALPESFLQQLEAIDDPAVLNG